MRPRPPSAPRIAALAALACLALACSRRPSFEPGDECELNTECAALFVCRLGHCRVECRAQRDCGPELECVRDELGLGACQLPSETECELNSDCQSHLVCHFGRCTNGCVMDRDCPPGAHCVADPEGGRGCRDESITECELNSDCDERMGGPGYVCAVDGRCRVPCLESRDCIDGRTCFRDVTPSVCGWPSDAADGGGGLDAMTVGTDAGLDATTVGPDGGMSDGGVTLGTPLPPRLAAGQFSTCAAPDVGPPRCWGDNATGQIGDGTTIRRTSATAVVGLGAASVLAVGQGLACAWTSSLSCWGSNGSGALGIGSLTPAYSTMPLAVSGLSGAVDDVSLGADYGCAILAGTLYCWGDNTYGQLGLGDTADRTSPQPVSLPATETPVRVDAFSVHTCVLFASGAIACFGDNTESKIGSGTGDALTPRFVPGIADAVDVATGSAHSCALRGDGTVWCWGSNWAGQVGNGIDVTIMPGAPEPAPTQTTPIAGQVVQVTAGSAHTCAVTRSGALYCWGDNSAGQTGQDRALVDAVTAPRLVSGLDPVEEVVAGSFHTCVRTTAGAHYCFGDNARGQLGNGTMTLSWTPVLVEGL